MKRASDLVSYSIAQIGRPYWMGGFGQIASRELYEQNKARLGYGPWEGDYEKAVGQKVHDCCGMTKGFIWTDGPDEGWKPGQYQKGMPDLGVEEQYRACTEKGNIADGIPEIPGLLVFTKSLGHMGIYIGSGWVVEARGHAYGVQRNRLSSRSFTYYGKLDKYIKYDTTQMTKVQMFQQFLYINYDIPLDIDGMCGPVTKKAAVKGVQIELNKLGAKLKVDGSCGMLTKSAMTRHMLRQGAQGNLAYIIQGLLYGKGYYPGGFDGDYGPMTVATVKQYQTDKGLEADGKVGGLTLFSLTR